MLTFSIVWVFLAASIILVVTAKRGVVADKAVNVVSKQSDRPLLIFAAVYGLALLTGFVYVGRFLVSSL